MKRLFFVSGSCTPAEASLITDFALFTKDLGGSNIYLRSFRPDVALRETLAVIRLSDVGRQDTLVIYAGTNLDSLEGNLPYTTLDFLSLIRMWTKVCGSRPELIREFLFRGIEGVLKNSKIKEQF